MTATTLIEQPVRTITERAETARELFVDLETASNADLKKKGAHGYAEADTRILVFAYKFDAEPTQCVDVERGESYPQRLLHALKNSAIKKIAFNSSFDMAIIRAILGDEFIDPSQWLDAFAMAKYLGLHGSLDQNSERVGLPLDQQKIKSGKSLIKLFCMPNQQTADTVSPLWNKPDSHLEKWNQFKEYAIRDVDALYGVYQKLCRFPMPVQEQRTWELDIKINGRGILVDQDFVKAAIARHEAYTSQLMAEATKITGIANPNSVAEYRQWLIDQEVFVENLTKQTVAELLASNTTPQITRALEIRQELSKTSITKYQTILDGLCSDGRFRDTSEYYGARTGRWSSRRFNFQNMPSPSLPDATLARDLIKQNAEHVELLFGPTNDLLSQLIRTAFIAPHNHRFICADFNAIEARVLAYCAGSEWRLKVFKTHGRIYETSAEKMFGLPSGSVDRASPYRKKGKVAELALGYGGGANALLLMGAHESESEREEIKTKWRQANSEIVTFWYDVENAAKIAVQDRTAVSVPVGPLRNANPSRASEIVYRYQSGFLFCDLPSGRHIAYAKPRIESQDLIVTSSDGKPFVLARAGGLTFEGQDSKTRRWSRTPTYAGRLVENLVQALARDILRDAMLALDAAGYYLLASIHDEVLIEASNDKGSLAEVLSIMSQPLAWAPGLPLKAEGFETPFFSKEL